MNPKVSVIMGVYNIAGKSTRGLDSILNQEFSEYEVVIVNDGSTDETQSTLEYYARKEDRIRLFQSLTNIGLGGALNIAISNTKADFLMRMDIDDWSYPNRMALQYEYLKTVGDVGVVSCFFRRLYENGEVIDVVKLPSEHDNIITGISRTRALCHGGSMIRKECFIKYGYYDPTLRRTEDYDLWLKWRPYVRFANIEEVLLDVFYPMCIDWEKTRGTSYWKIRKEITHVLTKNIVDSPTKLHDLYCMIYNQFYSLIYEQLRRFMKRYLAKLAKIFCILY